MAQSKLGKRISELRVSKGLTQQELADTCNLNVRTIQRIEAGEVAPRMYTLNLLAKPLAMDLNTLNQSSAETKRLSKKIELAFIAGAIFSINGIPIIYDLITHGLNTIVHMLISIIHILSCIAFFSGFYYIGSFYKNWILSISALMMAVLLPAINILDLIKYYYFSIGEFLLFILMSINMIIIGVGLLKESLERKGCENSRTYKIAGISIILTSVFYLTLNTKIINAGLILSLPANLVLVYILYKELRLSRENYNSQTVMD